MVKTRSQREKYSKEKAAKKEQSLKAKEKVLKEEARKSMGYLRNFEGFWAQNKPVLSSAYSWDRYSSVEVEQSTSKEVTNLN